MILKLILPDVYVRAVPLTANVMGEARVIAAMDFLVKVKNVNLKSIPAQMVNPVMTRSAYV